jgi:predicted metal-dependent hydrolase
MIEKYRQSYVPVLFVPAQMQIPSDISPIPMLQFVPRSCIPEAASLKIEIRRQRRRSMLMKTISGGVIVYIPTWLKADSREVKDFIKQGLQQLDTHLLPAREEHTTKAVLRKWVKMWAKRIGVQPTRISIRPMQRKWGSCSSIGSVTLNAALTTVPPELAEYVIVHELAHLKEFNHSTTFWQIVETHLPDYLQRKEALDQIPV